MEVMWAPLTDDWQIELSFGQSMGSPMIIPTPTSQAEEPVFAEAQK